MQTCNNRIRNLGYYRKNYSEKIFRAGKSSDINILNIYVRTPEITLWEAGTDR